MHLAHDNLFGLTAQLTVNVGAANANKLGTLFYYNVDNQILEYMGQSDTCLLYTSKLQRWWTMTPFFQRTHRNLRRV